MARRINPKLRLVEPSAEEQPQRSKHARKPRVLVQASRQSEAKVLDAVLGHLTDHERVYQRGGRLVTIAKVSGQSGQTTSTTEIQAYRRHSLREDLRDQLNSTN